MPPGRNELKRLQKPHPQKRRRPDSNRRITVLQTVAQELQPVLKQGLTNSSEKRLHTSLQKNPENGQKPGDSLPDDLAQVVAVWSNLPEHIKAAIRTLASTTVANKE